MQHPCKFLSFSNIWCDDKLTSDNTPPTPGIGTFLHIFSSSALNGKVLYGFLFEFDSLASHHTADLPSSSHSTQFRYNHWLQSQARAHFIYFIAFLRTFPSGGRGQVCRIEKRSHIWQRIQSCKIPRRHTGHAGYFEWFSCRRAYDYDGEVSRSDFLWPSN